MSSTTIVHITDSGIEAIERDPAGFVAGIVAARHTRQPRQDIPVFNHCNPATVLRRAACQPAARAVAAQRSDDRV